MIIINIIKKIINRYKYKKFIKQPINKSVVALIDRSLKLFPNTIDFSDGELMDDNGFYSNTLSKAWNNAEVQNVSKDENVDFMIWSIFGVLHKKCRCLFESGVYSINIIELDYNEIYSEYIHNCLESNVNI